MNSKTIDIFYQDWDVNFVEDIPNDGNIFVYGRCEGSDRTIWIRTKDRDGEDISQTELQRTLIHELLHAIAMQGGFYQEMTEQMVEFTSVCLQVALQQLTEDDKSQK